MNQAVVCSWAVRAELILVCLTLAIPAASGQVISEFLAHNNGLLLDQDRESPDWIEIHNPARQPVSLLDWSLTDSATNLTKWRFPDVTVAPDSYLVVFASGKDIRNVGEPLHTNFKLDDAGEYLALVAADGVTVVSSFQPAYPLQVPNISFGLQDVTSSSALLAATAPARVLIPANDALGTNWTAQAFDDSTWLQGANGVGYETSPAEYASLIRTDVGPAMAQNNSCYVRLPFRVDDPAAFSQWRLLVQYDDGFIAYLNGHEVARRNAPDNAAWNSAATANHPDAEAVVPEEFSLTPVADWIVRGTNVLALQGLNTGTSSSDFLILATVEARPLSGGGAGLAYFTSPTPGAPNAGGVQALGPLIESATHSPLEPVAGDNLSVAAKVLPTFHPIREVLLHYRVMFEPEVTVSMFDDGQHRDGAAGDGVFVGAIPAGAAAPAQMIRYFISATDDIGNATRLPLFPDPRDSAEYLGTVVSDPGIESRLPVVHWFAQTPSQADTPTGTRSSVYYGGEFYDNVLFSLHGQSSSGFPKRGYNVDFARDHRFRYAPDNARVKDIKLLTNWADKSRVRNALAYEFIRESGSVGHFAFQVRVQRNGQFHAILDLMEDADDRWMERIGRDPDGALYKMYNSLDSAGGNEKKTRRSEDFSDLQSLVNNLSPSRSLSNRVVYAYDNLDLPQTISYFVALALISSQDHGHKNYFLYRDSNASQEWAIFPWDVDLSWGRNWIDSGGYFTDTLYQNNVLSFYNSAQQNKPSNRLYDLIFGHPEFRRMYLRRLRTVMDTLLQPTGLPSGELKIEARIRQMMDLMDPPDVSQSDADLDFAKWGSWGNRNPMRQEAQRILDIHLPGRRGFLFTNSTAMLKGDPIPPSQATNAVALFGAIDANPASGRADEDFVELLNPGDEALDVSSWQLRGAVTFVFKAGTVLPAHGHLFVSPNVTAFRARQSGPGGGKGLYVQGNYRGSLTQAAEGLQLLDNAGRSVAQTNLPGQGPTISAAEIRGGKLWITVPGQPGRSYSIYFTEAVALEHWTLLQSVAGPEQPGPLQIPVSLQPGLPYGFYRIGLR